MPDDDKLRVTISLSRKLNLGNYESSDLFVSIGNITHETTEEDVIAVLDGPAKDTFIILKNRLAMQIERARAEGGRQ